MAARARRERSDQSRHARDYGRSRRLDRRSSSRDTARFSGGPSALVGQRRPDDRCANPIASTPELPASQKTHRSWQPPGRGYCAAIVNWDLRHQKSALVIRLLLAIWIAIVVIVLCATGRWWGLVFIIPLILDLYLLRRILVTGSGR
jgi:hypothetical protein